MVWDPRVDHYACEAAKIAPIIVPYVQGRCLDIGPGHGKVWPQCIGIDRQMDAGRPVTDICGPGGDLSLFANESCDGIFSSHFLEDIDPSQVPAVLREWWRVLKVGGYLTLYLPDTESEGGYAHIGDPHCNPDHRWEPNRETMKGLLADCGGYTLLVDETRLDEDEYSFLQVFQKRADTEIVEQVWQRNPDGKKRALIVRYAAIGDAILAASILPLLKKQGYHITFNTKPEIQDLLKHDPNIDEWVIQGQDFVPNQHLGPYWAALAKRYDHVINLSESIEGLLLSLPGRLNHSYSAEARRALYDHVNYLEHTHNIAAVPHDFSGSRFYPSVEEMAWARAVRRSKDGPVIAWCVNGSSVHKVYPWVHTVAKWLLERTPAHIVLYGDPTVGNHLATAILDTLKDDGIDSPRITNISDKWKIRQSLAFALTCDVIVGPETGPMNAMAMEDIKKVIYLSHSTPDNLTKHWKNTTTLVPEQSMCHCSGCHRLHYDWTFCNKSEKTGAALCASAISPNNVFEAIAMAIGAVKVAA